MDKNKPQETMQQHKCSASQGVNKYALGGNAFLQEQSGRHPIIITTLFCQACGHVLINTAQLNLPVPTGGVTVPVPGTGAKLK